MPKSLSNTNLEIVIIQCGSKSHDFIIRKESSDRFLLGQIFIDKSYDLSNIKRIKELSALYNSIIESGRKPLIIDAGANIGASSVYFSLMMSGAHVVAIEPDENNFILLRKNVEGLAVSAIRRALTSDGHTCEVKDVGNAEWGIVTSLLSEPAQGPDTEVQVALGTTVQDLFDQYSNDVPFIVKIDIEGAEDEVFSGDAEWIREVPLIVIEPHDWLFPGRGTMVNFFRKISAWNFDIEVRGENVFVINNDTSIWER